ncbi:hypothetical protein PB2503_13304 [Parvularcula bermudensis HTCC2503]|uniref:Uncharacterized protein n=1 Tax=Parvularcula bermudensis (strain ATCC BAA-594 / HTCC2503 / KCTC 12087) TaxID=314260 RepID=E0TGT9_PARBH|nr:hypothetical protein [Parvularcula bermudensis]ADM10698.1 hypothetical protein PB2503_13304 [Parvularcula bermudensis HTCC2503]
MGWRSFAASGGAVLLGMVCHAETTPPPSDPRFPSLADVMQGYTPLNRVEERTAGVAPRPYEDLLPLIPPARNTGSAWRLYKTQWDADDERGYEAFIQAIGRSGCISIDDCLRSPANPYRDANDDTLWLGDCTDMVYVLRGYYAWKNGLPFAFQDGYAIRRGDGAGHDPRYSAYGNQVTSRRVVTQRAGSGPVNGQRLLTSLYGIVSTAMFRVHPEDDGPVAADFYPLEITRTAIRPGTIAYDIYGHVSIVYEVDPTGQILLISSHPDYTVTREPFGPHVVRSHPNLGAGLKAWRPIKLVGATRTSSGTYLGGQLESARNDELGDFSMEQYYGTHPDETGNWREARYAVGERFLPYYEFVRERLRDPDVPYDPVAHLRSATRALCDAFKARRVAVNLAVYAGMPHQPHPDRLPPNIYGTYGDWERYATPSRDARLKTQAVELRGLVTGLMEKAAADPPLATALFDAYRSEADRCPLGYKRSDRQRVRFDLDEAVARLFDMSFDPFHCPERRWGAKGDELAACTDGPDKDRWYAAQRWLRNDPDRRYDLNMAFTADALASPAEAAPSGGGLGRATPPQVAVRPLLEAAVTDHLKVNVPPSTAETANDEALRPPFPLDGRPTVHAP